MLQRQEEFRSTEFSLLEFGSASSIVNPFQDEACTHAEHGLDCASRKWVEGMPGIHEVVGCLLTRRDFLRSRSQKSVHLINVREHFRSRLQTIRSECEKDAQISYLHTSSP